MLFGSRKADQSAQRAPVESAQEPEKGIGALDALAAVIRLLGELAVDIDEGAAQKTKDMAERWARHLLIGSDHPERPDLRASGVRDFVGARRFVEQLRRQEAKLTSAALSEFRSIVSSVAQTLHRAVARDAADDKVARGHLARLERALASKSLEELRREAASVTHELSGILVARERRREEQLESLGVELRSLHVRLEETRRTSETDPLTGAHNRRAFDAYLERVVEFDGLTGVPVTMVMLDVDHFKSINDQHGHVSGDEVLRVLGKELVRMFLRKCDFVARYGGEEFVIVLRDTELHTGTLLAERLCERMRGLGFPSVPGLAVTVSCGVAELKSGEGPVVWLDRTDRALLAAKRAGRDRVVVG